MMESITSVFFVALVHSSIVTFVVANTFFYTIP